MVPEFERPELRELIEGPYRIIYQVTAETVEVLAVVHGRQLPPWSRSSE
jgi:plasmid stabilization system protein ParE